MVDLRKKKKQPPSSVALSTLFLCYIDFYNTMIKVGIIVSVSRRRILEILIPRGMMDFVYYVCISSITFRTEDQCLSNTT